MGASTSIPVTASSPLACLPPELTASQTSAEEGVHEEDVFSEAEVDQLLSAVCEAIKDEDDRDDFKELYSSYKDSFLGHFCGMCSDDKKMKVATVSIKRSVVLNLSPWIINAYLSDKIGVLNSLHRELMSRHISQFGCRERCFKDLADKAAANSDKMDDDDTATIENNTHKEIVQVKRESMGRRKTQRFITKIDVSEKRITCVRRHVASSDFAISHRWHSRPTDEEWTIAQHTHTEDCWAWEETGKCAFIDYDPCAMSGNNLYCNYIQKDWTVVCACEENIGGRMLSYPDKSYKCSLTSIEAENLSALLEKKLSLWCDYICINQADPSDKTEQIPLMGTLYFTACTLILGMDFASCMPPDDYVFRAWCIQERDYGAIECHWDFENPQFDRFSLRQFVFEVLKRVPMVIGSRGIKVDLHRHISQGVNLCAVYEYVRWFNFENEPINEMTSDKTATLTDVIQQLLSTHLVDLYSQCKTEVSEVVLDLLTAIGKTDYDDDDLNISKCFLRLREVVSCTFEVQPLTCQYQVFDSQASFAEDRIYAIWGVPMWMRKQQQLPYPHHAEALKLIYKSYPSAEFAFYRRPHQFVPFTYFTQVQDLILHFITNGQIVAKEYLCTYHEYPITGERKESSWNNLSIVVAVNEQYIGVGIKQTQQENDQTAMWVVFNKKVLALLDDEDRELFCRLCFIYIIYEIGLFNHENYVERNKLFKFCKQFV
jgi:hypothetical protein